VKIIVMPEFSAASRRVLRSPGPLEAAGGHVLLHAPTRGLTPERVESFFKEYNDHMLKNLTIREAMPDHYLQGAH
jgi:hypothetical protein